VVNLGDPSGGNRIVENYIDSNVECGLLVSSSGNRIYHNIVSNPLNVVIIGSPDCDWDNGYPSGGNFWSDYAGIDIKSGAGQNLPGSDGIGDTQYVIAEGAIDRYPLMQPSVTSLETTDTQIPPEPVPVYGFDILDTVYVFGEGYRYSQTYPLYVVTDRSWGNGDTIPSRVSGTAESIQTDSAGKLLVMVNGELKLQAVWNMPLTPGQYDIVIDVNRNGVYDEDIDVLCDNNVLVTAGFFVVPEVPAGAITALLLSLISLGIYKKTQKTHINPVTTSKLDGLSRYS